MLKKSTSKVTTSKMNVSKSKHQVSTIRNKPGKENNENPFNIPQHMRVFSKKSKEKKEKGISCIWSDPKTICDIDEQFFNIIEGRPLRQFSDIKVYMTNIRDITLFRANAAYLKDQIIQIKTEYKDEIIEYEKIDKLYFSVKSSFVQFAKESYNKAKYFEELCKKRENLLESVTDELNGYSFTYNKLRNEIDYFEAVLDNLYRYGEFLFKISPDTWKEAGGLEFAKKPSGFLRAFSSDVYSPASQNKNEVLRIITALKSNKPSLYFKDPEEVINIFEELRKQCLNYMEKDVFTSVTKNNIFKRRDYFKALIEKEVYELGDVIEIYQKEIDYLENKETNYKNIFFRILLKDFHDLYASHEATKVFTYLQYVHTQVFSGQDDPKDHISTLAFNLEHLYIQTMSDFDILDQEVVKSAKKELFDEDRKMMKKALYAQRTLKECDILTKSLYASFEPPRRRTSIKYRT